MMLLLPHSSALLGWEGGVLFPNGIFQACHLFLRVWV